MSSLECINESLINIIGTKCFKTQDTNVKGKKKSTNHPSMLEIITTVHTPVTLKKYVIVLPFFILSGHNLNNLTTGQI